MARDGLPCFFMSRAFTKRDEGDRVHVRGMFEWNDLGGLVHWTHHDPQGIEDGGWVRYRRHDYA